MKITNRTVPILYKDINFEELSDGDIFASKDGLRIFMKIREINKSELNVVVNALRLDNGDFASFRWNDKVYVVDYEFKCSLVIKSDSDLT